MYILWETFVNHEDDCTYIDKGKYFYRNNIKQVIAYAKKRLTMGISRGWYIEDENGTVLEKHTFAGNIN